MAVVGDLFDDCRGVDPNAVDDGGKEGDGVENGTEGELPEICGCTISVRQSEDIISVWNRVGGDKQCREKIR